MNRFLLGAVALTSLVGVSAALPSGGSEEWVALDREIEALSSTLQGDPDKPQGMQVGGYIKTQYNYSADNPAVTGDESGFGFNSIRINITGQVGDYKIKVSAEGKSGTFGVADAYVRFPVHENVNVQVGQFKSRFLYSYYTSDQNTLFYDRAAIPSAWGQRDTGVQVDGTFGPFIGILQVQNGGDTVGNDYAVTAKAIYAVMGKAIEGQAGGFGPDAETALTLGVGYFDDGSVTDGDAIEGEAIFTHGPWYAAAEVVDHGTGFTNGGAPTSGPARKVANPSYPYTTDFSGLTPWGLNVAYQFNQQWQIALGYADDDDAASTSRIIGGVNYYIDGNATKWQASYSTASSDVAANEIDQFTLGLVVVI